MAAQQGMDQDISALSPEEQALAYQKVLNAHKFTSDLELVSALSSPAYLVHLAYTGKLHDAAFLRYLQRLNVTWRKPEYARFIRYPNSLYFLDALQYPEFRDAVGSESWGRDTAARVHATWSKW